jgi:PKD domain
VRGPDPSHQRSQRPSRFGWRARLTSGVAAVALVPAGLVLSRAGGFTGARAELSGGGAWLASPSQGVVTLIDGPAEQVVGLIRAPGATGGSDFSVEQAGSSAYILQPAAGTVSRVDGATYDVTPPVRFADPGGLSAVLAGGPGLYIVDGVRRTATVADPVTLKVRDRLSLAARPGAGQSVVDSAGRLWMVDGDRGGLTWFDRAGKHVHAVGDARSALVLVRGEPVLVDRGGGRVGRIGADGSVSAWSCLDVRAGDDVRLLGSAVGDRVYAVVPATGTLVEAGLDGDDCTRSVEVGRPGDSFGPLVQTAGFVLVPDRTTGKTLVVDPAAGQVVADFSVVKPGSRLELVAKDGLVFYNDLDGADAGVIRLDGERWTLGRQLRKFNPNNAGEGVLTPSGKTPPERKPGSGRPPVARPPGQAPRSQPLPGQPSVPPGGQSPPPDAPVPGAPLPPGAPPSSSVPSSPPSTGPLPPAPTLPPVIDAITHTPDVVVRGQAATFAADVQNGTGEGVTWHWTVTDPAAPGTVLAESTEVGTATLTVPEAAPSALRVTLDVTNSAGSAQRGAAFTSTTSRAPQIQGLAADDPTPSLAQQISFSATEQAAGAGATWTWSVTAGDGSVLLAPTTQPTGQPLRQKFATAGAYTVKLRVTFSDAADEATTQVDVRDRCTIEGGDQEPLDMRTGSSSQARGVSFVDCFTGEAPSVTQHLAPWLQLSSSGFLPPDPTTGVGGESIQVRIDDPTQIPDTIPDGSVVPDAISFTATTAGGPATVNVGVRINQPPDAHASGCENPTTAGGPSRVFGAVKDGDVDTVTLTVGAQTFPMALESVEGQGDRTYAVRVTTAGLPQGTFTITAVDPFGGQDTFTGSTCW